MNITIYDKNTQKGNFDNNGLAILSETISAAITEELNGRYDLTLIYPLYSNKIKYIKKWNILCVNGQLFRIINIRKDEANKVIEVFSNHISYDLNFGFVENVKLTNKNVLEAINGGISEEFKKIFNLGSDIKKIDNIEFSKTNGTDALFNIIEKWGIGELKRDNFDVGIYEEIGSDNGVNFRYRKNINGIEITEDATEVVTRIYPIGKDGITLKEKYVYLPSWNDKDYPPFHITKEVKYEDVESEGELRKLAEEDAKTMGLSKVNFKIDIFEVSLANEYKDIKKLNTVSIGDIVTVIHPTMNVDIKVRVIKIERDVLNRTNTIIELGQPLDNLFSSFKGTLNNMKTEISSNLKALEEGLFYFTNKDEIPLRNNYASVGDLAFAVQKDSNIGLFVTITGQATELALITAKIILDNKELEYKPKQTVQTGFSTISFNVPLLQLSANKSHSLDILANCEKGTFTIPKENTHIIIRGQSVIGGMGTERPHAEVREQFEFTDINIKTDTNIISVDLAKADLTIPIASNITESYEFKEINTVQDILDTSKNAGVKVGVTLYRSNSQITGDRFKSNLDVTTIIDTVQMVKKEGYIYNATKVSDGIFEVGLVEKDMVKEIKELSVKEKISK